MTTFIILTATLANLAASLILFLWRHSDLRALSEKVDVLTERVDVLAGVDNHPPGYRGPGVQALVGNDQVDETSHSNHAQVITGNGNIQISGSTQGPREEA